MCIRDRNGTAHDVQGLGDGQPSPAHEPDLLIRLDLDAAGAHDCLLYTSDAADDLLCVDLGGRRIIKKKKTYTNRGRVERHK